MNKFDVVIVGGGPAGGHCARLLAKAGHKILLVERFLDFERNNFSSAGSVLEILQRFDLPDTVVGSFWHKLAIVTYNQSAIWQAEQPQGVVLDFSKLRQFLADEVIAANSTVWMGHRYVGYAEEVDYLQVSLKNKADNQLVTVSTQILVDATGPARAILYPKQDSRTDLMTAIGIEYLIEIDPTTYQRYADTLTFFMGDKWMPGGYAWVFPMQNNLLKIGVGSFKSTKKQTKNLKPLKEYVQFLIDNHVKPSSYNLHDIHGGTLRYSFGLKDTYARNRIIAIGDSVSTVNFLGGEGIRHAMLNAEVASRYIDEFLQGSRTDFSGYQTEMHRIFFAAWEKSEKLAMKIYLADTDKSIDRMVRHFKQMKLEEIVDILFYYRFEKIAKWFYQYFWNRFRLRMLSQLASVKSTLLTR